ncbi:hypothetical protein RRG08_035431 [Elysia crispata]|uniref:Uncharacterized protein n=1 Tax=Elysia crispata TaxID=231223 RepID=A0AAE0Y511_9GAST|nr:hypothetical protein RRG08_035431 [Elysia crispata]
MTPLSLSLGIRQEVSNPLPGWIARAHSPVHPWHQDGCGFSYVVEGGGRGGLRGGRVNVIIQNIDLVSMRINVPSITKQVAEKVVTLQYLNSKGQ